MEVEYRRTKELVGEVNIVVVSTAAMLTPPINYGGMELEAYLLVKGLEERGHTVRLVAKTGSYTPSGGLVEINNEEEIPQKYIGIACADAYIDMSHSKILSHTHPELPLMEQYQIMTMNGIGKNPVLISKGQRDAKFPNIECEIIYQHIDFNAYTPNYEQPKPYFLTMAQIIEEKRIDWSIKVALLTDSELHVFGPWWGDANYAESIKYMAQGIPKIQLRGPIGGADKLRELREARALLHFPGAKGFCEAGSIIVLEALASGTPVIASRNGVHPEYIFPGINGYLVDSVQDAVDIIKAGWVEKINRIDCRLSVDKYHYPNMAEQYERLCQRVASGERWNVK